MSQPNWLTPAGSLGVFPTSTPLNVTFIALPTGNSATIANYKLLNGTLPEGLPNNPVYLQSNGQLVGTPKDVPVQTDYSFTIRVTDDLGNISDRTFSLTLLKVTGASILTPNGNLFTQFDSVYVDYVLQVNLLASESNYIITLSSGNLPAGLSLDPTGRIFGYAEPPIDVFNLPTTTTYNFSVQLTSELGLDSKTYSITIKNQQLSNPPNSRKPVILNNAPLGQVLQNDPFYSYYITSNNLPTIISGDYFSFKILGYDFDNLPITYNYGVLPDGLVGDPVTGWISGVPIIANNSIADFVFSVQVTKTDNPLIASQIQYYNITITNGVTKDIVWETDSNLGTYENGTISELFVKATSARELEYTVVDGSLPPNVTLSTDGKIIGRFPFEPNLSLNLNNPLAHFTFTVKAYNRQFTIVSSTKTFNLTINKVNKNPVENIYLKAYPNLEGRQILQSLLNNTTIIPTEYLYRNEDPYFGKAKDVKYLHVYGVNSTNINNYLNAITKNHYYRKIVLGEIKTAVARDENNNIIYEVVYSEIIDDLINNKGVSIPNEIIYPIKLSLNQGPYFVSNEDIFSSSSNVYNSYSPGFIRQLYPASLTNMRTEFLSKLKHTTDQNLLPKWMISQQNDGNTLGFIQAWVICYTLPNYSQVIANNIKNNWDNKLNMIDFTIDRYIVDKSATYNYDTNALIPTWTTLPGATPVPVPIDEYDVPVLFEQETILPNSTAN